MSPGYAVIRPFLSGLVFVVLTIVGSIISVLLGLFDRSGDSVLAVARVWSRAVLGSAGVKLRIRSHATFDPKRSYVVMPNHLSSVDIWAIFVAVPVPLRFIAKKQLGNIPLFGWAMKAGRFIFIDRQNATSARRTIDHAADRIRGGCSVVIFPEGTRSRDGRLGPFKKGGFHLALNSGADVVPVAIRGSREVMPRGSLLIRPGVVDIEVGEPIRTQGTGVEERQALLLQTRARIADMLGQELTPQPLAPAGDGEAR
ncbi:MAG TPA: lysophospholipid acyltransferase family protein [Polyangia bacterium]|jgi:1-acyl-sn-glycerol-3-phosphate acyltransferase|nr:lysophospholipid acyltransferase family protein [Polyangia bacterium]